MNSSLAHDPITHPEAGDVTQMALHTQRYTHRRIERVEGGKVFYRMFAENFESALLDMPLNVWRIHHQRESILAAENRKVIP